MKNKDTHLDHVDQLRKAAKKGQHNLEREITQAVMKQHAETAALIARQQHDIRELQGEVTALRMQKKGGGGFPWTLVLLGGAGYGAYMLYQKNPSLQQQVQGLLKRVNPGPEGNMARAGDAVKTGVSDMTRGESPAAAFQTAGGELRRGGEKLVDRVESNLRDGEPGR
ncbi:hypothetical protein L1280_001201 [Deinococcus sp. HSC-46F16]|uniref:hypothetical protein n=1 Tax=Deinococcus sp. HSC-46F16 TaxID=2910968 RepID=UPI0020A07007|nr:hypothetical protein [Deinococcus sp. HSC-46F16]MCP2014064.1 hypothetical protein [Deinococcus sp. HSC-46F16]